MTKGNHYCNNGVNAIQWSLSLSLSLRVQLVKVLSSLLSIS